MWVGYGDTNAFGRRTGMGARIDQMDFWRVGLQDGRDVGRSSILREDHAVAACITRLGYILGHMEM